MILIFIEIGKMKFLKSYREQRNGVPQVEDLEKSVVVTVRDSDIAVDRLEVDLYNSSSINEQNQKDLLNSDYRTTRGEIKGSGNKESLLNSLAMAATDNSSAMRNSY